MFRRSEYTAEIEENGADLKFVTVVTAQSQSSVSFDISAGNFDDAFLVNPTSGVVKARFPLDFEFRPFYNLTVRARNVAPAAELATLLVHVIDVNDNAPVFETLEYGGSTTEVASSGSFVLDSNSAPLVVRARDADSDRNALLTYSLVNDDVRGIFDVDASTGAVKVGDLARLNAGGRAFTFQVQVQDAGSPPLFAADVASVTVNVTDVNNSPPLFERRLYEKSERREQRRGERREERRGERREERRGERREERRNDRKQARRDRYAAVHTNWTYPRYQKY